MNPSTWLAATEQPSGIEMQTLCIQAMQLLTENMSIDELGAEIRRLTPLIQRLVPVIVHEHEQTQTDEDLRTAVRLKVETEWETLSEMACSYKKGEVVPRKLTRFIRNLNTNWTWPSPLPRLVVLELGLSTNKRIKHVEAISMLAKKLRCSFLDFLGMERREVAKKLFPVYRNMGICKTLYR